LDVHEENRREVMAINLNSTPTQHEREVIPSGVYRLCAEVKLGGAGPGSIFQRAKNGYGLMLKLLCEVVDGPHKGHGIFDYPTVELDEKAPSPVDDKERANLQAAQAALRIGRVRVRAIIDSALGLDPTDRSEEAEKKRTLESWGELDGLTFWAEVDERPGQGQYGPSNTIAYIVCPGHPDYPKTVQAVVPRRSLRDEMDDEIPY
jgi:hypothetical protein